MILRIGDRVRITDGDNSFEGEILLASSADPGITVAFKGRLGVYTGLIPLKWMLDHYEEQATGQRVTVTRLARVLPWPVLIVPVARNM